MSGSPPQLLREPVRELLRKRGEPIPQEVNLRLRPDGTVRLSLMKTAHDQYDEDDFPITTTQWYDPHQNAIVIPLPDPDDEDNRQLDFDSFSIPSKQTQYESI